MSGSRISRNRLRRPLTVAVSCFTVLLISMLSPAYAKSFGPRLLPADDKASCRHEKFTLYVPRDIQGYAFNFYCRDGEQGIFDNAGAVGGFQNGGLDGLSATSLDDWARDHAALNGSVDFGKLKDEPCNTISGMDISNGQCSKIRALKNGESPCDQWLSIIKGGKKKPTAQDKINVVNCTADNPVFQRQYKPAGQRDPNKDYDVHDYSAPKSVTEPFGDLITIAIWVAMGVCVGGVLISAGKMALAYRGGGEQSVIGIMWVLVGCVIAGSALGITNMFLIA